MTAFDGISWLGRNIYANTLEAEKEHGPAALGFLVMMVLFANSKQGMNSGLFNNSVEALVYSIYMLWTTLLVISY
ncbi:hypothetical protein M441DRAFT_349624 [Trichoderma asperellum CBS 433.97]|uniref:Uncharacterized protein n=1 Tax=Trichoderma asperellum (strain ATCC 204424 / CBS 433.97 / NBRC 101777) TaxID=1042311 RepID=A0A2T3ZI36_TRIA4|nr:hypothetical protein M441DRAFT_349624 [Trichoderma asperellum CBS 433.97]PTB44468.1 hypothetical protein M441DRAFT_349624 [Trichoderma asperellum CBS 433.97]